MRALALVAAVLSSLAIDGIDGGGDDKRQHKQQPPSSATCGLVAAEFASFVRTQRPGSRQLCITKDMVSDLGTLTAKGRQNLSIVGVGTQLQQRPRFFGRAVLDDGSKSQMLLQSITITSRNALQLPGCAGQSADVHCLGGAVWVGEPSELTAIDSSFLNLSSSDGGAIYIRGGTVLLRRTVFKDAHSVNSGGAIFAALASQPVMYVTECMPDNLLLLK